MKLLFMNASLRQPSTELEPFHPRVPEAALCRLRQQLTRSLAMGEAWDVSLAYGAPPDVVHELAAYWLEGFELERQPVLRNAWFTTELHGASCRFIHAPSTDRAATPLLLLHGYSGSPAEFGACVTSAVAGNTPSFHVVCPALPGGGLSDALPSAEATAEAYATLMARLGYTRYLVHGSDAGAGIALRLAALDAAHVAGVHVTALPAYPSEAPEALAGLSSAEKSQLARLSELHDELCFQLPEAPLEELAFALARLDPDSDVTELQDALLTGLTLSWALGSADARAELYRSVRLAPAPRTAAPVSLQSFPLDAPTLRRFAEAQHCVSEWTEHERGGPMPGLEQPMLLAQSLQRFAGALALPAPPAG